MRVACRWTNTSRSLWLGKPVFPPPKQFDNLSDLLLNSPFAGANLDLGRPKDYPRPVDLG